MDYSTRGHPTESGRGDGAGGMTPYRWIVESEKLSRFFQKLLIESESLNAHSITFGHEGAALAVTFFSERSAVKRIEIRTEWLGLIKRWCLERGTRCEVTEQAWRVVLFQGESLTKALISSERVNGSEVITISEFTRLGREAVVAQLEFSSSATLLIGELLDHDSGSFLVCAPTQEGILAAQGTFLSLLAASYAGDIGEWNRSLKTHHSALADSRLLFTTQSSDPIDALLALRKEGISPRDLGLRGIICHALARRLCRGCGREAVVDPVRFDQLPSVLKPAGAYTYQVGRGCSQCGHSGSLGTIPLVAVAVIDDEVMKLFEEGAADRSLIRYLHPKGLQSLIEDGVEKAFRGKVTLESLSEVLKGLPPAYEAVLAEKAKAKREGAVGAAGQHVDGDAPLFPQKKSTDPARPPRVLIVEDDPDQREILEMCLRAVNVEVVEACDGVEALTAIEKQMPDLIITDLSMPKMDGNELVKRLKNDSKLKEIPILVLTVISDVDKEYALLTLGADDYCEKTIQRKILLRRVENLLKRAGHVVQLAG